MSQIDAPKPPLARREKIPAIIKLPPQRPVDASEAARIKALIQQLATTVKPNFGLSLARGGVVFAPIPDSEPVVRMAPLTELVHIGPRALPYLLEALEDTTPTRLTIKLGGVTMALVYRRAIWGNRANVREKKVLSEIPQQGSDQPTGENSPTSYQVTIGDICFVIIGQIVGRFYQAVFYQASGTMVINTPTHDPIIVKVVRDIWSSDNPAQTVLDSLLLDYATSRTDSQIDAAVRLLYYFPRQIAPIVARRLRSFQVQNTQLTLGDEYSERDLSRWEKREQANGVRTDDFIDSIAWCREPEIREALLHLFQKSNDPELLLAMLPAIDGARHWPLIERRFQIFLGLLRPADSNWNGVNGFEVLIALHKAGGSKARPYYRKYLRPNSPKRCFAVCAALQRTHGEWDREFLWPMLTDKRFDKEEAQQYPPGSRERQQPRRVCDSAARVIAQHRKDVAFKRVGTTLELDRQITQMQLQLKKTR